MSRRSVLTLVALASGLLTYSPVHATFHLMQIEQVIAGVNGDTSAQAIQLRMRFAAQCLVSQAKLWAWDAEGKNPILLVDMQKDVANCKAGSRILIASKNFMKYVNIPIATDFVMTDLIPDSYLAAGSITLESDAGDEIVWRLSWGGAAYTGPTTGDTDNDSDGDYGPPYPGPLPSDGNKALKFMGGRLAMNTTNAEKYQLTTSAAVFTNNKNKMGMVFIPLPGCPWDLDGSGVVDSADMRILVAALGKPAEGPPDFDGNGMVSLGDLVQILLHMGICPPGD